MIYIGLISASIIPMVNILAKNAYFFPPPSSQGPYFFPVFAASHDTNMSQICGRSARSAKFLPFLPHIWQIALKIDLKQCNLGKFSLFCVSNFRVRSLFLPHFSRMLISSPPPGGALLARIYTVVYARFHWYKCNAINCRLTLS